MNTKKLISPILILVLALQLLPIKQAVRYFFVDNALIEEFVPAEKDDAKNFQLPDDDHFSIYHQEFFNYCLVNLINTTLIHFDEMLPANYISDIQTPPPNKKA